MTAKQVGFAVVLALSLSIAGCDENPGIVALQRAGVRISNLRDKSVVETGFMVGTSLGATSVEVSLDGGAYAAATGTTTWSFKLPTGGATWKQGSAHTIAVRAKDSAGYASTATTLSVRKGNNKDVNGDGYPDVVVGAYNASSGAGKAFVFHSGGSAGIASANDTGAAATLAGTAVSGQFGYAVALGDVNGDGYADVVVGAQNHTSSIGKVFVFHSAGSTGVASANDTAAATTLSGTLGVGQFGSSLAVGDVNGDGYADVAVGAYNASLAVGFAYAFHSAGGTGVASADDTAAATTLWGTAVNGFFGYSLAMGDVNGDGFADIVVGAPNVSSSLGKAYVFHSTGSTGVSSANDTGATATLTGTATAGQFGTSVALGDVNGDGLADIVVGAANVSTGLGKAYVFHSAGGSGVSSANDTGATTTLTGTATGGNLGYSVALGDANGDGYADVLVGAWGVSTGIGKAYVFHSAGGTGVASANDTGATSTLSGTASVGLFGGSLAQ